MEEGYLSISQELEAGEIHSRLNEQLPVGFQIEEVVPVAKPFSRPEKRRVTYIVSELIPWRVRRVLQGWPKRLEDTLHKKTKSGETSAALGEIVLDVRQSG